MIASFHDNETLKIWKGEFSRRLPNQIQAIARRKLRMLNNPAGSTTFEFLHRTGWRSFPATATDNGV
jgi:plasmid maintenance system killer protein